MNRHKTLLTCVAYMLVLVVAGVATDRVIANRTISNPGAFVPAYRSFQEYLAGIKLRQVSDEGGFPAVFLGNSRTLFGVDPHVFDDTAAARGAKVRFKSYYRERPPKRIIYGITARDLDDRNVSAQPYEQAFKASPGFTNRNRTGIWKWSEEALAQLYTLRGRVEETRRARKKDIFRPGGQRDNLARQYTVSGDRGYSAFPPRFTKTPEFLLKDRSTPVDRHGIHNLQLGAARIRAIEGIDRYARAHGGCVTFYSLPVFYDPEPWGTKRMQAELARFMRGFVRTHPGTQFVDVGHRVEDRYSVADFGDPDHLNRRGATRFSRDLGKALAPDLRRGCANP
jgi:hypothetical protein